jgi:hypothetical protein
MSLATIRRWWAALNYEPFQISRTIRWDVDQFEVWIAGLHKAKSLSSEERWTSHAEARCESTAGSALICLIRLKNDHFSGL